MHSIGILSTRPEQSDERSAHEVGAVKYGGNVRIKQSRDFHKRKTKLTKIISVFQVHYAISARSVTSSPPALVGREQYSIDLNREKGSTFNDNSC